MFRSWLTRGLDTEDEDFKASAADEAAAAGSTTRLGDEADSVDPRFWIKCLDEKENSPIMSSQRPLTSALREKRDPSNLPSSILPSAKVVDFRLSPSTAERSTEADSIGKASETPILPELTTDTSPIGKVLSPMSQNDENKNHIMAAEKPFSTQTTHKKASSDAQMILDTEPKNDNNRNNDDAENINSINRLDDDDGRDPYSWAYDVWRKKGLMVTKRESDTINCRPFVVKRKKAQPNAITMIIDTFEDKANQAANQIDAQHKLDAMVTPRDCFLSSQFDTKARGRLSLPVMSVAAKSKQPREVFEFSNILNQWRQKSDDKPNAHFLSPEHLMPWTSSGRSRSRLNSDPQVNDSKHTSPKHADSRQPPNEGWEAYNPIVSQASKLKEQYLRQRSEARARSRGRSLNSSSDPSNPPQTNSSQDIPQDVKNHFRRNISPPKSRGDFRKAAQDVLRRADVAESPATRSVSAPKQRASPIVHHLALCADSPTLSRSNTAARPPQDNTEQPRYRSKSAPRSSSKTESRLKNIDDKNIVVLSSNAENDDLSRRGRIICERFKDASRDASIPMQVEIRPSDSLSIADTKLTDVFTHCESVDSYRGPCSSTDSPWIRSVLSELQKSHGDKGKSPNTGHVEKPWRHDRLVNRVGALQINEEGACQCAKTVFSDKDDMIDFFLPLMGTGCTCGKRPVGLQNPEEPTSLENILRPWQVEFLAGFGITRGDQMVKAHHRSARPSQQLYANTVKRRI